MTTVASSTVTRPYAAGILEYARSNDKVVSVTNDLTKSVETDLFRDEFPERYFSLGMAEQNLAGVLSGLAREGLEPFYPSFAVFVTRRPYEQVALNIAYPNLPVRLIGFLPGITTPGGVTHQATDDLRLMSGLPNMTVLSMVDATDVTTMFDTFANLDGPVYCRIPRGEVPVLFDEPFKLGKARILSEGDDLTILSEGVTTLHAIGAVEWLAALGVGVRHLSVSTIRPFVDPIVVDALRQSDHVLVTENHMTRGGLASAAADVIATQGFGTRLSRVGIDDTFTHGGEPSYLFDYYGIDTAAIANRGASALGLPEKYSPEPPAPMHAFPAEPTSDAEGL